MKKLLVMFFISLNLVACSEEQESDDVLDNEEAALEAGISTLSGISDDMSGASFADYNNKSYINYAKLWQDVFISTANANNVNSSSTTQCTRAYIETCNSGNKEIVYDECTIRNGRFTISGELSLAYSDSSCSMSTTGNSVTRTYNYTMSGPRGGSITHSSNSQTDYNSNTYGGGATLTKTASAWELNILGKHKTLTINNEEKANISIRSIGNITMTGGLSRSLRRMSNGQLEINHNIAQFSVVYTLNDLQWSASCCHPISGSIQADYSGSISDSATIEFNSCGSASIERNGETKDVTLSYCE